MSDENKTDAREEEELEREAADLREKEGVDEAESTADKSGGEIAPENGAEGQEEPEHQEQVGAEEQPQEADDIPQEEDEEPQDVEGEDEPEEADEEQDEDGPISVSEMPPEAKAYCKAAIEALLCSTSEPVSTGRLARAISDIEIDGRGVRSLIGELIDEYDESRRGFLIEEIAGGFRMVTRPEYAAYVGNLLGGSRSARISPAALETLAVIAYKQPVTRADIEAIRGVQAGPLLRSLLQKQLIRIAGRAEIIGRPFLYGTTRKFLEHFGLNSLDELPDVDELPEPEEPEA